MSRCDLLRIWSHANEYETKINIINFWNKLRTIKPQSSHQPRYSINRFHNVHPLKWYLSHPICDEWLGGCETISWIYPRYSVLGILHVYHRNSTAHWITLDDHAYTIVLVRSSADPSCSNRFIFLNEQQSRDGCSIDDCVCAREYMQCDTVYNFLSLNHLCKWCIINGSQVVT